MSNEKTYCCYLLANNLNCRSYCGITLDFRRRFRQHSKLLKGGARATSMLSEPGRWHPIAQIIGFQNKTQSLQFELCMKQKMSKYRNSCLDKATISRIKTLAKNATKKSNRVVQLLQVLSLPKWTPKAINSDQVPLRIVWYTDRYRPQAFSTDFLNEKEHLSEIIHPGIIDDCTVQIYNEPNEKVSELVHNPIKQIVV